MAGAQQVLHRQGVEATTLAHIAAESDVPVGNVYYYFRTKDDLVGAAIEAHTDQIGAALEGFSQRRTPRARLKALVASWGDSAELVARQGCPHGSLCSELDKRDDALGRSAAKLLIPQIDWAERQFREMGLRNPRDLAMSLLASFQGAALLANTLRDPTVLEREARRLQRWIDSLE